MFEPHKKTFLTYEMMFQVEDNVQGVKTTLLCVHTHTTAN